VVGAVPDVEEDLVADEDGRHAEGAQPQRQQAEPEEYDARDARAHPDSPASR
jgi:hypothetical protein